MAAKGVPDGQDPDWPAAAKFVDVQVLLDHNVVLISQINDNHTTRTPEALERNVLLIRELNSNVQRITELYQDIASVLTGAKPEAAAAGAATAAKAAGQKP